MSRSTAKKAPAERRKRPRTTRSSVRAPLGAKAPTKPSVVKDGAVKDSAAKGGAASRPGASKSLTAKAKSAQRNAKDLESAHGALRKKPAQPEVSEDSCIHCSKDLEHADRALLVEEEIGRVFCSEECIATYFAPEIARLEKTYFRNLSASDLKGEEREKYAHLRWITLEEPDEVWREKTLTGDHRYTLISEFRPGTKRIWCVCICLFLRGEPSFLFIAFPTANAAMVSNYRRGERIEWENPKRKGHSFTDGEEMPAPKVRGASEETDAPAEGEDPKLDSLAHEWTDQEVRLAALTQNRKTNDIPPEQFDTYQSRMDPTLEAPDELWTLEATQVKGAAEKIQKKTEEENSEAESDAEADDTPRIFHFIKYFSDESPGFWYVIVARETAKAEEIEILEAFPTRDADIVEEFRRGSPELGVNEGMSPSRLVH